MFSRNIFIKWRHESILFTIVYANNISIRIIKTLHKSSFPKVLSYRKFYPKYQALFFFSSAAVPFNKYNFYSVKILHRRNHVIAFTFLKECYSMQRNVTASNSL